MEDDKQMQDYEEVLLESNAEPEENLPEENLPEENEVQQELSYWEKYRLTDDDVKNYRKISLQISVGIFVFLVVFFSMDLGRYGITLNGVVRATTASFMFLLPFWFDMLYWAKKEHDPDTDYLELGLEKRRVMKFSNPKRVFSDLAILVPAWAIGKNLLSAEPNWKIFIILPCLSLIIYLFLTLIYWVNMKCFSEDSCIVRYMRKQTGSEKDKGK